jgi:hypothetical protein
MNKWEEIGWEERDEGGKEVDRLTNSVSHLPSKRFANGKKKNDNVDAFGYVGEGVETYKIMYLKD